jgi:hypothetical protein
MIRSRISAGVDQVEEVNEVLLDARKFRVVVAVPDEVFPHADERARAARGQIETAEQLLARRLHRMQ